MKTWSVVLLIISFCLLSTVGSAQSLFVTKEKIENELEERGLDVEEVTERLRERGVDLTYLNYDNISQDQIALIQEVILEMEEEQLKEELAKQRLEESEEDLLDEETLLEEDEEMESDSLLLDSEELLEEGEEEIEITIYGQELFRRDILDIQPPSEEIKAPESYVLGPGDDLVISIWGKSQIEDEYEIGEDGFLRIIIRNGARRVFLKGVTLGEAKEKVFNLLNDYYNFDRGQFDLALNSSRTIRVGIYGEVYENPGSVALSAFNSAFNALAAVKGTNDIGSLRNIILQKSDGRQLTLDVYAFMKNPAISKDYYLEDNDVIIIPRVSKVVSIEGAIRRPLDYELKENEGIRELLDFAGGFSPDAFQSKIQVQRYQDDQKKVVDVDWREYKKTNRNFILEDGDVIIVESIEKDAENTVEIVGEVYKPGVYQRTGTMKIYDLIRKAGVTPASSTDLVYLTRTNTDGTVEYRKIFLTQIMSDPGNSENISLQDNDIVEVWNKNRFTDDKDIAVDGAVRFPGTFNYDKSESIRVKDAILLAGGLRRDASNYAIIHRNDPLNPKVKSYKTIDDLQTVFDDESSSLNYTLDPFDSLVVKSKNTFLEESFVRIEGAVNSPGEYQYGADMTIKDLMTLAGGFKMAASTNNIEISRVIIKNNEPTKTVVANVEMDRNFNVMGRGNGSYVLQPFDNVAVRYIKEFQLQKRVFLEGEVAFPGPYAISKENEKILSILERAGGLTDEAFPAGATLIRDDQDYGSVVIKLEEIIHNPSSEFNFYVKNGDRITVPKIKEFVTIKGATRAREVVGEESINEGNVIHVPFHKNKDAMFYINEYAGGLHERADRQKIFVEHANGEIKRPRGGFLVKRFPKVFQGSVISVGYKSLEQDKADEKSEVNWTEVLGESVGQAMSILTLILLINQLD